MGRLIVSMNLSLDGYIEAQEQDDGSWLRIDEELHRVFNELAAGADAFLYGRKVYEVMIPYWPEAAEDETKPAYEREYGRLWVEKPKLVASRSLQEATWNTRVVADDVFEEIARLKNEAKDYLLCYGGAQLVSALQERRLVDLELHPENARPYDVLLGHLGADRLAQQGRDPFTFPQSPSQSDCRFFAETGHNVCGDILAAWRASGLELDQQPGKIEAESLALFGLPLSDPMTETLTDGRAYTVQWFERARFELHPENQPPYNVLLGLLGNEVRANSAPPVAAPPKPLPPPTYNNCQADPNPDAAPNYPVAIVQIDKGAEVVTLQNVSQEAIDLTGWHMCSIKGNQQHPIGGVLAPGERRAFPSPDGTIWNNMERDDGALYNAQGQLVSYHRD